MEKCIFDAIANHESPAEIEYEDDEIIAFRDINPKTKVHILIVPKKHISSLTILEPEDIALMGKLIYVAKKLAEEKGIADDGYRICVNAGKHGGQVVDHIHFHLIGGEELGEMI